MDIRCRCPACEASFSVGQEFAGQVVRCIQCGSDVRIEAASGAASASRSTSAAAGDSPRPRLSKMTLAGIGVALALVLLAAIWYSFPPATASIVLEIPETQRAGLKVVIDDEPRELPLKGPAVFAVKPGRHRLRVVRQGQPFDMTITLTSGETYSFRPPWAKG